MTKEYRFCHYSAWVYQIFDFAAQWISLGDILATLYSLKAKLCREVFGNVSEYMYILLLGNKRTRRGVSLYTFRGIDHCL